MSDKQRGSTLRVVRKARIRCNLKPGTLLIPPQHAGLYSQLLPCGHPDITDTPLIRTAAKSQAKIIYRCLTEINSSYYGLSLMRTLTQGPHSVRYKGS